MKMFRKVPIELRVVLAMCLCVVLMAAGVNGIFNHVTSTTGYQVAGSAGSSGEALCSDGTNYDLACPIPGSVTLYYQTIQSNGTSETQRTFLNFTQRFSLSDSASPSRSTVDLNAPGNANLVATYGSSPSTSTGCAQFDGSGNLVPVTPPCMAAVGTAGTYAYPVSITTNTYGQVTAVTAAGATPGTRHDCFSGSGCAGGGPYVSGSTYTNSLSVPVMEEVGMTTTTGSCTGADSSITYSVAGSPQGGNGVWNQCNGVAHVTFIVPAGATFSATVTLIDGGASPALSSWSETVI